MEGVLHSEEGGGGREGGREGGRKERDREVINNNPTGCTHYTAQYLTHITSFAGMLAKACTTSPMGILQLFSMSLEQGTVYMVARM